MTEPSQKNLDDKIRQFIQANEFDNNVISALEHYVYVISDSYDTPLYVGKGVGGRVLHHFKNIIDKEMPDTRTQILRALFEADQNPKVVIARYGIKEASEALIIESVLIDMLIPKLNKVLGHKAGQFGKRELIGLVKELAATPVNPAESYGKVFLFPILNSLRDGDSAYEATRKSWSRSSLMNDGQGGIAIGLANGISVAVFQIDKWEKVAERKNRWTFSGTDISLNSELCNRNYSRIIRGNGYWQRGSYVVVAFDGPKKEFKFLHGSKDKEWRDLLKT